MVLELKAPELSPAHGAGPSPDPRELAALRPLWPVFLSYALSYVYLGIYWNNHHHMLHAARHVSGSVLWANLHLLFWLSLVPFVTAWMGKNEFAPQPTAVYGVVLLMAALAYWILLHTILRGEEPDSVLRRAVGGDTKGKLSPLLYIVAIAAAFVHPGISGALYVIVALIWLVPDRRIERVLVDPRGAAPARRPGGH